MIPGGRRFLIEAFVTNVTRIIPLPFVHSFSVCCTPIAALAYNPFDDGHEENTPDPEGLIEALARRGAGWDFPPAHVKNRGANASASKFRSLRRSQPYMGRRSTWAVIRYIRQKTAARVTIIYPPVLERSALIVTV